MGSQFFLHLVTLPYSSFVLIVLLFLRKKMGLWHVLDSERLFFPGPEKNEFLTGQDFFFFFFSSHTAAGVHRQFERQG